MSTQIDSDEVKALLSRILEQRTFSAEAAEGIATLRAEKASLIEKLEAAISLNREKEATLAAMLKSNEKLSLEITQKNRVIQDIVAREAKVASHEKDAAVSAAKTEAYRECVGLIFRNTVLKKTMFGTAPAATSANPNQYVKDSVSVSSDETFAEE